MSKGFSGRTHSEETKQRIAAKKRGSKASEQTRQKMSQAQRGKVMSPEARLNMRNARLGVKLSEEHRRKLSEAHMGLKRPLRHSEEEEAVRREAHGRGEIYYYYPRACANGHDSRRYVKDSYCRSCHNETNNRRKRKRQQTQPEYAVYCAAQQRAREKGLPFGITMEYIKSIWPEDGRCPVLGIILKAGSGKCQDESPSLDKVYPDRGYVPGNVAILSHKANTLKQDVDDPSMFDAIADWLGSWKPPVKRADSPPPTRSMRKMVDGAKKRAKQGGFPFDIDASYVSSIWPRDNRCPIFGEVFSSGIRWSASIDKVDPSLGYVVGNIAIISRLANSIKNTETDPRVFRRLASWMRGF